MVDSVIIAYAMMSISQYAFRVDIIPWNIPEKNNFQKNILSSILCFILKCIPINRLGDRGKVRSTLGKCEILLKNKQSLMIFPEGTRSRTGRINTQDFPYGVGRLLCSVPECKVLCIYSRGDGQNTYSTIPKRKEIFTVKSEVIQPISKFKGLKAQRDFSGQIISHLSKMEITYYAEHQKRY